MSKSLTKSKKRVKELGEVFTPLALVEEMLDRLPSEVWAGDKTFLDPTCGHGNFLVGVVKRKVETGSTPLQALRTTFGIDIMDDNVRECRERLLEAAGNPSGGLEIVERNIRCADSLELDWAIAFDEPAAELQPEPAAPIAKPAQPAPAAEREQPRARTGPCRRGAVTDPNIRSARTPPSRSNMVP